MLSDPLTAFRYIVWPRSNAIKAYRKDKRKIIMLSDAKIYF